MIIRTALSLIVLAALSVVANAADDYEYNYEEYENGEEDVDHEEEDKEVNYEQVNILSKSQDLHVAGGTTFHLPCKVDNLPAHLYQNLMWTRQNAAGTIISAGKTVMASEYKDRATVEMGKKGSTLTLILAEEEDAGVYQCRINLGKTKATVDHRVHIGSERLVLSEGDDMILTCNTSRPVPVVWKWDGGNAEYSGKELTVDSITKSQAGHYVCKVGKDIEREVVVEVLFKPEVYVAEVVMSSLTGDVAELVCSVRGKPTPEVHWRKAGAAVGEDRRRKISWKGERNSLTILELGEEDLAEYTCHASNSQGEAEQSIQLTASVSSNESLSLCLSLVLFLYVLVRHAQ